MFKPNHDQIKELAKLAVINGVNVQKGQPLVINAPVEAYELVRECVKVAYEQGSSYVSVNYLDDIKTRLDYEKVATEIFNEMSDFANYAFNKSHAAAYSVLAYRTGWLKAVMGGV